MKISNYLLAAGLALGMSILVVQTASAEIVAITATQIDDILIESDGFDLGGSGFANDTPTGPAKLLWNQYWFGPGVSFSGTLHLKGVSANCAMVKLVLYGPDGEQIDVPDESNISESYCASTNDHKSFSFTINPTVYGMTKVKVRLINSTDSSNLLPIDGQFAYYGPDLGNSHVNISRYQFDYGSADFQAGTASEPATVNWQVVDGTSKTAPTVSATLYMKNAFDLCGRMVYEYRNDDASLSNRVAGKAHCVSDNDLHTYFVHADGSEQSFSVKQFKIIIEKSLNINGAPSDVWEQVGAITATLPAVPVGSPIDQSF